MPATHAVGIDWLRIAAEMMSSFCSVNPNAWEMVAWEAVTLGWNVEYDGDDEDPYIGYLGFFVNAPATTWRTIKA